MNPEEEQKTDKRERLRTIMGIALILIGCVMLAWVLPYLFNFFHDPFGTPFMQAFMDTKPTESTLSLNENTILFDAATWKIVATILNLILISVAANISVTFIRSGSNLLNPDTEKIKNHISDILKK